MENGIDGRAERDPYGSTPTSVRDKNVIRSIVSIIMTQEDDGMTPKGYEHPQIAYNKALKQALDNYSAFEKMLPGLLNTDENKFVVLHNRQMHRGSFGSWEEALSVGRERFGDGNFSIQRVAAPAEDCGGGPQDYLGTRRVAFAV